MGGHVFNIEQEWLYGETLRKWVRRAEIDQGKRSGMTSSDRERFKELERENRGLKQANEILR